MANTVFDAPQWSAVSRSGDTCPTNITVATLPSLNATDVQTSQDDLTPVRLSLDQLMKLGVARCHRRPQRAPALHHEGLNGVSDGKRRIS